jgi:UDP-N-acetylmuramate dehydrogenase
MKSRNKNFEKLGQKLKKEIAGRVEERVLMKRFTTFRIGGICELMVFPKNLQDLTRSVEFCEDQGLTWKILGKGSNLLVRDEGWAGVLINLQEGLNAVDIRDNGEVRAEAGVRLSHLLKLCQDAGLSGLEFCAGIPGTVGGAIKMNAGAEGWEIGKILGRVEFYRHPGGSYLRTRKELKFDYRHFELKDGEIVIAGEFELAPSDPRSIRSRILNYLKRRRMTQPVTFPSAGSVFKNPPGNYAGKIIEELGLKGHRVGDAQVSEVHANFIINRGRAKAAQVLELVQLIQERAKREKGIALELEIEVVGKSND